MSVGDAEKLAIAVAAANGHAAYAWWKAYGDAFHLNPYEMATIAIPNRWIEVEGTRLKAIALGRRLIGAINHRNIIVRTSGTKKTKHESLNFHECERETIAEIDRLYLTALGLPLEPLLTQLRTLRSNNAWQVGLKPSS